MGDIITRIKGLTSIPVAVLTNGSLLWRPEVRAGLMEADLVLPSLDAGDELSFERVNRPHPDIAFDRMVDGLLRFSHDFNGKIWLEVFVLAGITDQPDEMGRIAAIVEKMRPSRVQLNTVSRPPAEGCAIAAPGDALESLCGLFPGTCEVIAESPPDRSAGAAGSRDVEDEIVALVNRRPCTVEGIATGLGLRPNEVLKHLEVLCSKGAVRSERRGDAVFYDGARYP